MTAIKAADVDRFIAKPNPEQPVVLVFGPDTGLVRERVDALVRASVDNPDDPFALARIEGDELAGNPSRLVEEALTVPMDLTNEVIVREFENIWVHRSAVNPSLSIALRFATDAARDAGLCGAPTCRVRGQLFWGQDRLLFVEKALAGWRGPSTF